MNMHRNRSILGSIAAATIAMALAVALAGPAAAAIAQDPDVQSAATPAHIIQGQSPLQECIESILRNPVSGYPCDHGAQPAGPIVYQPLAA